MRVAQFVQSFSPLSETFVYELIVGLRARGVDSTVLTLERTNEAARPFDPVHVIRGPSGWRPSAIAQRIGARVMGKDPDEAAWNALRLGLAESLAQDRYDVLHAHFGPAGVIAAPVAKARGIPLVVSLHGFDVSQLLLSASWSQRYRSMLRDASALTVVAGHQVDRIVALGCPREKVRVVHVGCDVDALSFRSRTPPVARLVALGRLVEKKGHADAVEAVARARAAGHDVTLDIIGDGPLRPDLEGLIAQRDLTDAVHLLGGLPHARSLEHLAGADALLLCSKTSPDGDEEGIPVALMEAQALGLPCISTRHGGIPEGIPAQNHALLAQEGDVGGIADRIGALRRMSSAELRTLSDRGRAYVEAEFNVAKTIPAVMEVYRSVAAAPSARPAGARQFYDEFLQTRMVKYRLDDNPRLLRAMEFAEAAVAPDSHVLDIGCGIGIVTERLARKAARGSVLGCDLGAKNVWYASRTVRLPNVRFVELDAIADWEKLRALVARPVDVVTLIDVIEHLPKESWPLVFQRIAAVSGEDARVLLTFPSPVYQRYLADHDPGELQPVDESVELEEIERVAGAAGWSVSAWRYVDVWMTNQYVHCELRKRIPCQPIAPRAPPFGVIGREVTRLREGLRRRLRRKRYVEDVFGS